MGQFANSVFDVDGMIYEMIGCDDSVEKIPPSILTVIHESTE